MSRTVNEAFNEFMRDSVNLDSEVVKAARSSRDNLLENIEEFSGLDDFFTLWKDVNIQFGSFGRKTKCRELDDIDLMVGIGADGATYYEVEPWDDKRIFASKNNEAQQSCANEDGTLNSTKVLNLFKKKLGGVKEYSRSEINKNGEAVTLNLKSKDWAFDIVPCFQTVQEDDGRSYYLIPNGKGKWKKTAPDVDRDHVANSNRKKDGKLLELIRLCKKWNKVKNIKTMPSYLLETMLVNYADSQTFLADSLSIRFWNALEYIGANIYCPVDDMKGIQGHINTLSLEDRAKIRNRACTDSNKCLDALADAVQKQQEEAIKKWGEIFGKDFPTFG